jgi:hypothetical protein
MGTHVCCGLKFCCSRNVWFLEATDSYVQRRLARLQRLQSGRFRSPIGLSALAWQRQVRDSPTLLVSRFAKVTKQSQNKSAAILGYFTDHAEVSVGDMLQRTDEQHGRDVVLLYGSLSGQ